eukprot:PLAT10643.1.p1 GENE.PLAT10643.1~~PLAT10643.1.p1  ORF type:complete len:561 (+),score=300.15 PLAT10643.1:244-1926(+)
MCATRRTPCSPPMPWRASPAMPGVAVVTAGPGLTNTVTAIKNAQMAQSPLVLMGGAAATVLKNRGALQDIEQLDLFRSICKWTATCSRVRDIVPTLRTAFQKAQSGTPGPVFVELPIDTLYPISEVKKGYGVGGATLHAADKAEAAKPKKVGLVGQLVQWYLKRKLEQLFADAFVDQPCSPLPLSVPSHSGEQVAAAVAALSRASSPVLVVGSQAVLTPAAADALAAAVSALGIPVYLTGMARGLMGRYCELQMRQKRRQALRAADVIVLAGVVCDFRMDYGRVLNKRATIVSVNRSTHDMKLNSDMFWRCTQPVHGDPGAFLTALGDAWKAAGHAAATDERWAPWIASLREREDAREAQNAKTAEMKVDGINPLRLCELIEEQLPDDSVLVVDGGDFVATAAYIVRPRGPLRWLDPGAFGTLGVGAGFALGAKLVRPSSQVWIFYGDGSAGYSVAEYDTFTRHKLPVISVVGNDACWTQIARDQVKFFKDDVALQLAHCDYDVVARGFGGEGIKMEPDASDDDMRAAIRRAQQMERDGVAVLLNAIIGNTNFREGSISV